MYANPQEPTPGTRKLGMKNRRSEKPPERHPINLQLFKCQLILSVSDRAKRKDARAEHTYTMAERRAEKLCPHIELHRWGREGHPLGSRETRAHIQSIKTHRASRHLKRPPGCSILFTAAFICHMSPRRPCRRISGVPITSSSFLPLLAPSIGFIPNDVPSGRTV